MATPTIGCHTWGFFQDDNSDINAQTQIGTDNSTSETFGLDTNLQVRIGTWNNADGNFSDQVKLQAQINSGATATWFDVNGSSSYVRSSAGNGTEGTDTCSTQLLSSFPSFSFENDGQFDETDGAVTSVAHAKSTFWEDQWCVQLRSAELSDTDLVEFRTRAAGTANYTDPGTFPQITVSVSAVSEAFSAEEASYQHTGNATAFVVETVFVLGDDDYQHTGADADFINQYAIMGNATAYPAVGAAEAFQALMHLKAGYPWAYSMWANGVWANAVWNDADWLTSHGADADFLQQLAVIGAEGIYPHTGAAITLLSELKLQLEAAIYEHTGAVAELFSDYVLLLAQGMYEATGGDQTYQYIYELPLATGVYKHTGSDAAFVEDIAGISEYPLAVDGASYQHTGATNSFQALMLSALSGGSFEHTGADAELYAEAQMSLEADNFQHTGADSTLYPFLQLVLNNTNYPYQGQDTPLRTIASAVAEGAILPHTGADAAFGLLLQLIANSTFFPHTGYSATFQATGAAAIEDILGKLIRARDELLLTYGSTLTIKNSDLVDLVDVLRYLDHD